MSDNWRVVVDGNSIIGRTILRNRRGGAQKSVRLDQKNVINCWQLTYLSLDLLGVASVRATFTCRSASLEMGTDPEELLGGQHYDHADMGKKLTCCPNSHASKSH
jgi:hypothetical protein